MHQVSPDPCPRCGGERPFAAQLAADLGDIGDCGAMYLYACPAGCSARAHVESL